MEEILVKKIESGIRSIKLGLKSPKEASVGKSFTQLKSINDGLYIDLLAQYKTVVDEYNKSKK